MSLRYCKTSLTKQKSTTPNQCHYFTLWIKRSSCIKTHSIITDNCKKIRPEYQLTTVRMSELKAVLEMTTTHLHTSWNTSTPLTHSCSNDGVIQLGPLSSDAMFEIVEISDACFIHCLLQDAPHAVVLQLVWRWVVVISSIAFNSDIRTVVGCYSGLIFFAFVSYEVVRFNTWRSFNSQGPISNTD